MWVRSAGLPNRPKLRATLLRNKWIEARVIEGDLSYRITERGLAEMIKPTKVRQRTWLQATTVRPPPLMPITF